MTQKRKARDDDREYAALLAKLYRERHPRDGGKQVPVMLDGKPTGHYVIEPTPRRPWPDIGDMLDHFARHGTFDLGVSADRRAFRDRSVRVAFAIARGEDISAEDAIATIAEAEGLSESSVQKIVYRAAISEGKSKSITAPRKPGTKTKR